jgi:hypothetical protein
VQFRVLGPVELKQRHLALAWARQALTIAEGCGYLELIGHAAQEVDTCTGTPDAWG